MSNTYFKGTCRLFGDHVDTDIIIPARYMHSTDENYLGQNVFSDLRPNFAASIDKGDILIAGQNFGCGSSREAAPVAIRGAGISCLIAESYARIFYRNCINRGFYAIEIPEASSLFKEGDKVSVDVQKGIVTNHSTDKQYTFPPFPDFVKSIIEQGGLFNVVQERLNAKAKA